MLQAYSAALNATAAIDLRGCQGAALDRSRQGAFCRSHRARAPLYRRRGRRMRRRFRARAHSLRRHCRALANRHRCRQARGVPFFRDRRGRAQLRFMASIEAANRDQPHVLAMYAFAMELNGLRAQAEAVCGRALEMDPNTMWAQHCLGQCTRAISASMKVSPRWSVLRRAGSHSVPTFRRTTGSTWARSTLRTFNATVHSRLTGGTFGLSPDLVVEQTDAILLLDGFGARRCCS